VDVTIFPRPVQPELPVWITSSGNLETFRSAGAIGASVLTHMIGAGMDALEERINVYRDSLEENGFARDHGQVALMLHTHLGSDTQMVKQLVRAPFREYLRSAVNLEVAAAKGGGTMSASLSMNADRFNNDHTEELLDITFERYFKTAALMGTPEDCVPLVRDLARIGVDEVACLIDFLDDSEAILDSLPYLNHLRNLTAPETMQHAADEALALFMEELE
jgi:natural product biosynthesis luciferase-like monooxygenase protein